MATASAIFCHSCGELILAAETCPVCGAPRPALPGIAGSLVWHAESGRRLPRPRCYPALAGGRLCLPTDDGAVVGLDLAAGALAWEHRLPEAGAAYGLTGDGSRVFVGPYDTQAAPGPDFAFVAIDGATGEVAWSFAGASSYSGATCADGAVFVATSAGRLHALDAATGHERWSAPHSAWGPAAPAVAGGLVIVGGRSEQLVAYDATDGRERWRFSGAGWFATRPAIAGDCALARSWDGFLYAVELASGALRWKVRGERGQSFSSPPAAGPAMALIGDRVQDHVASYALRSLSVADGSELWRFPTSHHVTAWPTIVEDVVICPCENGLLYALDLATGDELWSVTLADNPTASPVVYEGVVYAADARGGAYAVRLRAASATPTLPDALLAAGDLEGAAAAFVLRGDPIAGALIYGRRLGRPREAARIYEHIDLPDQAAPYWEQAGEIQRARDAYRSAGDLRGLAGHLLRTGETLAAAQLYEQMGRLADAAALYEQAGDKVKAAELFRQAGQTERSISVTRSRVPWERKVEQLIGAGRPHEAAELLLVHGQLERAASVYEESGSLADALLVRIDLQHWEKVADLALRLGDLEHAAVAYANLGQKRRAAEIYEQAARQSLGASRPDLPLVTGLFEAAARLYEQIFDSERAEACAAEVRRHGQLPELRVTIVAEHDFVEQEWNTVTVVLANWGHGPARAIQLREPRRFELNNAPVLAGISPGRESRMIISARPMHNEIGHRVPLELTVAYRDTSERAYEVSAQAFVRVVPQALAVGQPLRAAPEEDSPAAHHEHHASEAPLTLSFRVHEDDQGHVRAEIRWEANVIGRRHSTFVPPYSKPELDLVVRALDLLQYPTFTFTPEEIERLQSLGLVDASGSLREDSHRQVGQALHRALVADQQSAQALGTMRDYARAEGRSLALRLYFPPDAIELAALPWELLWDDGPAPVLLSQSRLGSCTRHLDLAQPIAPPHPRRGALRILAISPHAGIEPEARERERAERTAAWGPLIASGDVVMHEISPATRRSIVDYMLVGPPPDIIHFVGHGRYADGLGWLILDGPDGAWDRVPSTQLMPLFDETWLVVLCSCQGATSGVAGLLTGIAPALSAAGVPAVVAMQLTVRSLAATRFTEVMYKTLARGESLQRAVMQARQALYVEEHDSSSWYVPTLTIRARNPGPLYLF